MTPDELRALADEATPGPWTFRAEDRLVLDAENYHVAHVLVHPEHPTQGGTARLVALAPDLARLCADLGEALGVALVVIENDRGEGGYEDWRELLTKLSKLKAR